jgi:altronate hydrolase
MIDLVNMIVLSPGDNVGNALRGIAAGEGAHDGSGLKVRSLEEVPQGHKIALKAIEAGEKIVRFGVAVGIARAPIPRGRLVHVHNVVSQYLTNDEDHYE